MKPAYTLLFLLFSVTCVAQETITLKTVWKPKSEYITKSTVTHSSEMTFSGDSAVTAQIKNSGVVFPIVVKGSNEMQATTTTGKRNRDKTVPGRIVYDRMTNTMDMNGKVHTQENTEIVGSALEGYFDTNGLFNVDTVISTTMNDQTREVLLAMLKNLQAQVKFPDYPLAVGDSFHQEVPLQIPITGMAPMQMVVRSDYTLTELTSATALFDVVQTVELAMELDENSSGSTAHGSGKGVVSFDRKMGMLNRYETDMIMSMVMRIHGIQVNADMQSTVVQTVELR